MGRPKKPIQRRKNGIYFVQLHVAGRRVVRSLETRDPIKAAPRAEQAIRELQEAETGPRWTADTPVLVPAGDHPIDEHTPAIETTWSEVAQSQEEIKTLAWIDLIREADNVRKRKEGKPYGSSWHRNIGIAIRGVPFTLQEASPQTIRAWIKELQDAGLSGLTINNKCSLLSEEEADRMVGCNWGVSL